MCECGRESSTQTDRKSHPHSHTPLIGLIALARALVTWSAITLENFINKIISRRLLLCHSLELPSALLYQFTAFPGTLSCNESQISVWSLFSPSLPLQPPLFLHSFPYVSLNFSPSISLSCSRQTVLPIGLVVGLASRNAAQSQWQTNNGQRIIIL